MPARTSCRGDGDGGQARRAVAVVGEASDVLESGLDGRVAGDVAAAVEGLAQHDVVDELGVEARSGHGLRDHLGGEGEPVDVDEGALEGGADGRASGRDDPHVTHRTVPPPLGLPPDPGDRAGSVTIKQTLSQGVGWRPLSSGQ